MKVSKVKRKSKGKEVRMIVSYTNYTYTTHPKSSAYFNK